MRLLKWLGVQPWKLSLLSGIATAAAIYLAEKALPSHAKAIEHVGGMVGAGLIFLGILILIIKAAGRASPKKMVPVFGSSAYLVGFQILVAVLASNGNFADSLSWLKAGFSEGLGGRMIAFIVADLCLLGIPFLVLIYPQDLRRWLPWDRATKLSRKLLPAWLAAAAAAVTWIYILLLHFAGGPLASTSMPVLLVAGFGVATLLVPLYQFMARSCWRYGREAVFDPGRWHDTVVKVRSEIKDAKRSYWRASMSTSNSGRFGL